MKQLIDNTLIEKSIQSKLNKPISKGSFYMYMGYLEYRHNKYLDVDNEKAERYMKLMQMVQETYDKFKEKPKYNKDKAIDWINK